MYIVILAGGGGTRLHPLSRAELPKPFLPLLEERSLLSATYDRVRDLTADITVVTDRLLAELVIAAPPRDREVEAAKAKARSALRYGTG